MSKTSQRSYRVFFCGCLTAALLWQGQSDLTYTLRWDPGSAMDASLHFSDQDTLTWLRIASHGNVPAEQPTRDQYVIEVFDKLVHHALLAKYRGNVMSGQTYFHRGSLVATYFNVRFDNPSLLHALEFYDSLAGSDLKNKLAADRFLYQGYDLYCHGRFDEAVKTFNSCRRLYAAIHDERKAVESTYQLASVALAQRDYSRCRDLAVVALEEAADEDCPERIGWLHWLMGEASCNLTRYEDAKKEFAIALDFAEVGSDTLLMARAYERLGVTLWRQGDLLRSLDVVRRSRRLSSQIHYQRGEINCLILLGMINRGLGSYAEAGECYEEAYTLNQTLAQPELNPLIATNWAFLYIELGDWEHALQLQLRALQNEQAKPEPINRYLATYYSNIGLIYSNLHQQEKAVAYQKLALSELKKTASAASEEALTHLRMGDACSELGESEDAENFYTTALSIAQRTKETTSQVLCLLGLSNFYWNKGEFSDAQSLQMEALDLAHKTQSPDLEWNASFALGKTYEALKRIDLADDAYTSALQRIETSRKRISVDTLRASFFASKQDVYNRLMLLRLESKNDPESALHYSEQSRARTMLDILGERIDRPFLTSETPRLADLQAIMPADLAFVEYKVLPDKLIMWVVKKDEFDFKTVSVSREELTQLVRKYREAIGADNFEKFRERFAEDPQGLFDESLLLGERLVNYLVTPIEKYLSPNEIVYFIQDDILYYVPFAALAAPGDPPRFLIEKYKVAYIPSLTVYSSLIRRQSHEFRRHPPKILVIGNPTGDLKNSEKEAQSIADSFPASQLLVRGQASRQVVMSGLQSNIDYFHFAGHCRINTKSPMHSALLLSGASSSMPVRYPYGNRTNVLPDDAVISVQDLMSLPLDHVELATLSACETALGRLFKGEGMMGFNHALLGSGIGTLVSSLWKVDDRYSAELMQGFYRYLATQEYSKLDALRQAQLDKIAWCRRDRVVKRPFPYFWASYVLNGMND